MATTSRFPAGREAAAVRIAIASGARDANVLTNLIFHGRHPARLGRMLNPAEHPLLREWYAIRRDLVGPLLRGQRPLRQSAYPPARRPWWLAPDPIIALEAEWEHWRSKAERGKTSKRAKLVYDTARRPRGDFKTMDTKPGQHRHHRIELAVLKGYPGVFTSKKLNSRDNLVHVDAAFHSGPLKRFWNDVYRKLDADLSTSKLKKGSTEYRAFVRSRVEKARDDANVLIDRHAAGLPVTVPTTR